MERVLDRNRLIQKIKKKGVRFVSKAMIFILLCGLSYIVLYPFLFKVLSSFMSENDMKNILVDLIPMEWSTAIYEHILTETAFVSGLINTTLVALLYASLTTISASMIGYGLSKCKYQGANIILVLVIISMLIPIYTLRVPIYLHFRFFDFYGLLEAVGLGPIKLLDTPIPYALMSLTGYSFRSGIFIILMRQYYIGVPDELLEAGYVDGAGPYYTFIKIILPMAKSMMIVVFALSFAWAWTDTFYTSILTPNSELLTAVVRLLNSYRAELGNVQQNAIIANTGSLLAIFPLILFYLVLQKKIIQGIERSGLTG